MSVAIRRYRMGTYVLSHSSPKSKLGAEFQRIKASKRRRNMCYAHLPTKYRKSQQQKKMLIIVVAMFTLLVSNIFFTAVNHYAIRSFHIDNFNDQAVTTQAEAVTSVEPERKEENLKFSSTLPVLVENPDIEEIKKYEWKHITTNEAIAIVDCESEFQNVKNPASTASGKWMFTEGTWKDGVKARGLNWTLYDRFDYVKATNMAHWYIEDKNQLSRWDCARILKIKSK